MKGEIVSFEKAADQCCNVLPGDLIVEILQRLSVKSLLRLKSVSKGWLLLILHPQFIAKHLLYNQQKAAATTKGNYLHRYHHDPHCRNDISKLIRALFFSNTDCCPEDHHQSGISLISKRDNDRNNPFSTSLLSLDHRIRDRENLFIVGCSNGLVCLKFNFNTSFAIWNPATRKLKLLPRSKLPDSLCEYHQISVGFSYVPGTACYKLVRISALQKAKEGSNGIVGYVTRVQVFNMGNDCWKEVLFHGEEELSRKLPCYIYQSPVVVNGCLHWFGRTKGSSRSMIWFDMEKEVFITKTEMSYPFEDDFKLFNISCDLTVFDENLAMFVSPSSMFPQLWIYKGTSWKKQLTFGPLPTGHYPMGFWEENIIIKPNKVVETEDGPVVHTYGIHAYLYNPYCKEKTHYCPCREINCNLTFYPYIESLLQI